MATREELEYLIKVNDRDLKELKRNFDTVNKSADKELGTASTAADGHLRKMGNAAKIAGAAAGGLLVIGIKKSVDAALDAQRVQKQTEAQLHALGISYGAHAKQINSVIDSTSKLAAVDDEDLQQSFTRLLPATHSVSKALDQMQTVADVARARNISLESATNLVIRANTGSAGALRRLGISLVATNDHVAAARKELAEYKKTHDVLSPAMDKHFRDEIAQAGAADKHAQAVKNLDVLQKTFSGSAKAYGESAAGAQDRFGVALENVQEAIGGGLLPMLADLLNVGARILDFTQAHARETKIAIIAIGALATTIGIATVATKIWTGLQTVAKVATAAWTAAQWLLNAALDANPIALVVIGIAALVAAIVIAWQRSETFRNIVTGAWTAIKAATDSLRDKFVAFKNSVVDTYDRVINKGRDVVHFVTVDIPGGFNTALGWVRAHWPEIATLLSGPFAPLVALATGAFGIRAALVGALEAIETKAGNVAGSIVTYFENLPKRLGKAIGDVVNAFGPLRQAVNLLDSALEKVKDAFAWIVDHAGDIADKLGKIAGVFGKVGGVFKGAAGIFGDGVAGIDRAGNVQLPTGGGKGPNTISPGLYDDLALGTRMGLTLTSGYRPGAITSTGNHSLHSVFPSKAIDMSGSEAAMRAFFQTEIGRPGIAELIHSPYWWHPGSGIGMIPAGAGTVLADHYNHVHVGIFDQGGILPPGLTLALNATGRPERVTPAGADAPIVHVENMYVRDELDAQLVASAVNRALAFR